MQVPVGEFVAKVKFKAYEEPMIFEVMGFETTAGNNHYAPIVITESGVMTVRTEEFGQVEKVIGPHSFHSECLLGWWQPSRW
jgi:hypothetical protein